MSIYTASGNAVLLDQLHIYADRIIKKPLISGLYQRLPLLAYLTSKSNNSALREKGFSLLTGGARVTKVMQENESGSEVHDRLHNSEVGGFKWMTTNDTSPSTGQDANTRNKISAVHRWALAAMPFKVDNMVLRTATGDSKIANAIMEARDEAVESLLTNLNLAAWYGSPASQSADTWSTMMGILPALDTDNTYGNVNRATYTSWAGKRVTSAKAAALSLVEDANITQGVAAKGPGIDFALTSPAIYNKLKQEALARGQSIVVGSMPSAPEVGATTECIKYGNTVITYDPLLTGTDWSAYDSDVTDNSKLFIGFTTEDWVFSINPAENFRLTPLVDNSEREGGSDTTTGQIRLMPRLRCRRPWRSIAYTNVA